MNPALWVLLLLQQTQLKPGFLIVLMNPAKLGYLSLRTQLKPRFNLCWTQLSIPGCLKVEAEFPILSLFPATKTYHLVSHELFLHLLLMLIHVISFFHFPFAFCIYIGLATLLPTWPFPASCKIAKVKPLFKDTLKLILKTTALPQFSSCFNSPYESLLKWFFITKQRSFWDKDPYRFQSGFQNN